VKFEIDIPLYVQGMQRKMEKQKRQLKYLNERLHRQSLQLDHAEALLRRLGFRRDY
jgi:hypothetical protein